MSLVDYRFPTLRRVTPDRAAAAHLEEEVPGARAGCAASGGGSVCWGSACDPLPAFDASGGVVRCGLTYGEADMGAIRVLVLGVAVVLLLASAASQSKPSNKFASWDPVRGEVVGVTADDLYAATVRVFADAGLGAELTISVGCEVRPIRGPREQCPGLDRAVAFTSQEPKLRERILATAKERAGKRAAPAIDAGVP